ncbi:MAG: hypothetical protein ACLP59_19680 [Bryobacteraceae bacterium]
MSRVALLALIVALVAMTAMAQTDVLGAHNVYGRGCVACHSPHSGANGGMGTGMAGGDSTTGDLALWGQNLTPLYGQTINFGDAGGYPVTLPTSLTQAGLTAHDPTFVIIACLSCHDGNLARPGMMKGSTVETLPVVGGNAPTFLGSDGSTAGNYNNDHPVGPNAKFGCGPPYNWDCTINASSNSITWGPISTVFVNTNYAFPVSLAWVGGVPEVTCTTCHDQHSEIIWSGKMGPQGQQNWNTSFFVRGPYTPSNTSGSNVAAQFCRSCHGGESNEEHGLMNVPTTGATHQ